MSKATRFTSEVNSETPPETPPCPHGYQHCVPCDELRAQILRSFPLEREWLRPSLRFSGRKHLIYHVALELPVLAQTAWRTRAAVEAVPAHSQAAWLEILQDLYPNLVEVREDLVVGMRKLHGGPPMAPEDRTFQLRNPFSFSGRS